MADITPVSVDVSGIDMLAFRSMIPPAKSVVVPPDFEQQLPDVSPMDISHGMALLPAQVEEDVDQAQMLAEFGTLPAIVMPIHDPQEARAMPPVEYRPPEAPADVVVAPAGPADDDRWPPTGSVGCSTIALAAPAVPTLERKLLFPEQTWIGPPPGAKTADYRLPAVPLPSCPAAVSQPVGELDTLRECVNVLICLARGRSIFIRTVFTPMHRHDRVRIVRVVHFA